MILTALVERELISITELTELLGVSHMTVRRDIQKLEQEGRVLSVSGGVQLSEKITSEPSHLTKRALQFAEKTLIAHAAAQYAQPGMSLYLDAGTTSLALAQSLESRDDLMVINYLIEHSECKLYHTGGLVLRENCSCVGDSSTHFLHNLNVNISFISSSSWNARWISMPTEAKVAIKKAAVAAANKRILICDSSKYGKVGTFNAVSLEEMDIVISDSNLPESAKSALLQTGVHLVVAE
ncbi:DeoR/GlpR family DNA-binding transcription regulator [Candidatus Symbiopectobacterium sp. 'North America']|uniref:DeoR/GlpR family DNA-binding transcription regulator n=1 Tax=Candidatus Symbiopectobacterium sp. 'North America' TaxID=2794574 RepID=UPI001FD01553|nr:DeoR/GlpR family DNA-binding transcription regulator [Candidatus Symbiopectobacterium sp. 'North America']